MAKLNELQTTRDDPRTVSLLRAAASGSDPALPDLLQHHRGRLLKMVAQRLDPRVSARIDASDVVQETLVDATRKFDGYLQRRPLPFHHWLRRLANERLSKAHRFHVRSSIRGVAREQPGTSAPTGSGEARPVDQLASSGPTPIQEMIRHEDHGRLQELMDEVPPKDREVLRLRYVEGLRFAEIATALGLAEGTVKVRHFRALERIRKKLVE
jgi:RNA polymerase sigma-70 factor (ECF subfamily)